MRMVMRVVFVFVFVILSVSCGEKKSRRRNRINRTPPELPTSNAKVAFIFPAGAGAAQVILAIAEQMEQDLGINHLGEIIDMAGGISSGSIIASALTHGNPPRLSASALKSQLSNFISQVFPNTQTMLDRLANDYEFGLVEFETIFKEILQTPPNFSSLNSAETSIQELLVRAALKKPSIMGKVNSHGGIQGLINIFNSANIVQNLQRTDRAALLQGLISGLLGNSMLNDPINARFVAFASHDKKPVFFAPPGDEKYFDAPYAEGSTPLYKALISSAAIPGFIKAPTDIRFFSANGGGPTVIADLKDGFFATSSGFDPSAIFYDFYTKKYSQKELLIIFVNNGARVDGSFRRKIGWNRTYGVAQSEDKKVTFVAIDSKILDQDGHDLFNVAGFYSNPDLTQYMDEAAKTVVKEPGYKWAIEALSRVIK